MFCPNCGTESDSKFCPKCGMPLQEAGTNQGNPSSGSNPNMEASSNAKPPKKKNSVLGIVSLILSFLGPLSVVGLILAIVDIVKDKKKEYKHGLSIAAIVISLIVCYAIGSNGKKKDTNNTDSAPTLEVIESSEEAKEAEVKKEPEKEDMSEPVSEETKEIEEAKPSEEPEPEPEPEPEEPAMSKEEFIASCTDLPYKDIARNPNSYIGQNFKYTAYVMSASEGGFFTGYQKYYKTWGFNKDEAIAKMNDGWADNYEDAKVFGMNSDESVWLLDNRKTDDPDYIKILEKDTITVYGTFTGLQESKNALTGETGEEVALDIKYVELIEE